MSEAAVRPEILYIMGTARSGTTILEILLGNNPGHINVGEVTYIFTDGYVRDVACTCGRPTSACALWAEIRRRAGWTDDDVRALAALTRRTDWHTGLPAALLGRWRGDDFARYAAAECHVFSSVGALTNARVVVESSVYAPRALALARAWPGAMRILCITRDPVGILASFRKRDTEEQLPKRTLRAFLYYMFVLLELRVAMWRLRRPVLIITFEELMRDPDGTLARIERWSGLDLQESRRRVREGEALRPGHIVTGNRMRKQPRIVFRGAELLRDPSRATDLPAIAVMKLWRRLLGLAGGGG